MTVRLIHYSYVIVSAMTSQFTSLTIVYSTVYSGAVQRKYQAPRHWPLWVEFNGDRWIPQTKDEQRGKCFHLMTSSCIHGFDGSDTPRLWKCCYSKIANSLIGIKARISNYTYRILWDDGFRHYLNDSIHFIRGLYIHREIVHRWMFGDAYVQQT